MAKQMQERLTEVLVDEVLKATGATGDAALDIDSKIRVGMTRSIEATVRAALQACGTKAFAAPVIKSRAAAIEAQRAARRAVGPHGAKLLTSSADKAATSATKSTSK